MQTALGAQPWGARGRPRPARTAGGALGLCGDSLGQDPKHRNKQPSLQGARPGLDGPACGLPRSGFRGSAPSSKLGLKNSRWERTRELPRISSALDTLVLFLCEAALSSAFAGMGSVLGKAVARADSAIGFLGTPQGGCSNPLLLAEDHLGEGPQRSEHTWQRPVAPTGPPGVCPATRAERSEVDPCPSYK